MRIKLYKRQKENDRPYQVIDNRISPVEDSLEPGYFYIYNYEKKGIFYQTPVNELGQKAFYFPFFWRWEIWIYKS